MKADTPEMKAWLRVFNTWMPDFLIDNHVTDGSDMQYDVTWDMARNQDIAEPAGAWVREKYVPELDKRMAADGHMVAPYGALRNRRILHGSILAALFAFVFGRAESPVVIGGNAQPQNRPHPGLGQLRHHAPHLRHHHRRCRIVAQSRSRSRSGRCRRAPAIATPSPFIWPVKSASKSRPIVYHALKNAPFKSEVTGANVTRYTGEVDDIQTVIHDQIDTTLAAQMPLGYLIPAAFTHAADLLHNCMESR